MSAVSYDVVIPTIRRPSLAALLSSIERSHGPKPDRVIIVEDSERRGPAATRNCGWRQSTAPWVVFLDDDVLVSENWCEHLARDLASCNGAAGSQGRIVVPLPDDRAWTDYERNVKALEDAAYITADCAYRREALERTGGFDERFPRAYREDADLALRMIAGGLTIARGERTTFHPVRSADRWVSVRLQAGNADDALMARLHGKDWRQRARATRGCFSRHCVTVAFAFTGVAGFMAWTASTLAFAYARIAKGPRTPDEIATMLATSALIPFAAVYHRLRGMGRTL